MRTTKTMSRTRRVRWPLLVLLWVWAGCVALTLDLFFNVEEFDAVRPRARIYRATRYVAHRIVGERYRERDEFAVREEVVARVATVRATRAQRRPPDAATPRGGRLLRGLAGAARTHPNLKRREAAMRSMARMFGADARAELETLASDPKQPEELRTAARHYLNELR